MSAHAADRSPLEPNTAKVVAGAWSIQPSSREEGGYCEQSEEGSGCQRDGEEGHGTMLEEGAEAGGVEGCEKGVDDNRSEEGSGAEQCLCMMEDVLAQDPLIKDIGVKYLLFHGRDEEWPGWSYDFKDEMIGAGILSAADFSAVEKHRVHCEFQRSQTWRSVQDSSSLTSVEPVRGTRRC